MLALVFFVAEMAHIVASHYVVYGKGCEFTGGVGRCRGLRLSHDEGAGEDQPTLQYGWKERTKKFKDFMEQQVTEETTAQHLYVKGKTELVAWAKVPRQIPWHTLHVH